MPSAYRLGERICTCSSRTKTQKQVPLLYMFSKHGCTISSSFKYAHTHMPLQEYDGCSVNESKQTLLIHSFLPLLFFFYFFIHSFIHSFLLAINYSPLISLFTHSFFLSCPLLPPISSFFYSFILSCYCSSSSNFLIHLFLPLSYHYSSSFSSSSSFSNSFIYSFLPSHYDSSSSNSFITSFLLTFLLIF